MAATLAWRDGMGPDVLTIMALIAAGAAVILLASWVQSRSYKGYLDRVAAENAKLAESQRLTQTLLERQTAALDRIAVALEKGKAP